jgi:general secretion pathway protein K
MKIKSSMHYCQQGVALVMVLWIAVLLTIMAASFSLTVRREATLTSNIKEQSKAKALAEAGVYYGMMMLLFNDAEQRWVADGGINELLFDEAEIKIQITAETGKIDLNNADQRLLVKLFEGIEAAQESAPELADAILDWRDTNDLHRLNGAELDDYRNEDLPYGPRNGPFQTVEELQLVLGMNAEIYEEVEPLVTIFSEQAQVDLRKAPSRLLEILQDKETEQDDDLAPESIERKEREKELLRREGIGQSIFNVVAQALLPSGQKGSIFVVAQWQNNGQSYKIHRWKENVEDLDLFANEELQID